MNITSEQQEVLLSIARDVVALGDEVYIYNDNNGRAECLFCNDSYGFAPNEERHANHDADCTYLKACNLLKSLPETP